MTTSLRHGPTAAELITEAMAVSNHMELNPWEAMDLVLHEHDTSPEVRAQLEAKRPRKWDFPEVEVGEDGLKMK